ncbi:MAG: phosphonate ABC transporter, permease protein PhnE [Azospirillum sp.]|nr:phosphonate ABC transporter, permease protein PhnE [Azospirillum sp.]MCZ8124950.1 phosphonate ABC transporter, permease protein PhnE [Magnetospirillum sp.]
MTLAAVDAVDRFEHAWAAQRREKRRAVALGAVVLTVCVAASAWMAEVNVRNLVDGIPGAFDYIWRTVPVLRIETFRTDMAEWYWGFGKWSKLLFETVVVAGLATLLAFAIAYVACFPASANLNPNGWSVWIVRRALEVARAVPTLVYALIFVFAFGLGALPGMLAVMVHSAGALGKLFAEVNENVDPRSVEGVQAAGASWWQTMRYGVSPQVMPNYASYALLRFEINVREAAVLGFVGAGGIGEELLLAVRQFIYPEISAIVLMIVATVAVIDIVCERLRTRLMGGANRA